MAAKGLIYKDRGYELVLGDYKNDPNNAVLIDNLQITFDVSKSSSNKAKTNSCVIDIYNLDDSTIALLDKEFIAAELNAGYYSTSIKRLFAGEVASVSTRKNGTDIITQIRMGAAYSALNLAIVNKLVPPGTTHKKALEILVAQTKGINRAVITGNNCLRTTPNGQPITGTAKQALDNICEPNGMEYTIDDGSLYVMDKGASYTSNLEQAIVVSPDTGLYDIAYKVSGEGIRRKPDPAKQPGIEFKAALNADYKAGSIIKLEQDDALSGWYKVESVRFAGQWRGGQWTSEIRCSQRITT